MLLILGAEEYIHEFNNPIELGIKLTLDRISDE